MKALAGAGDDGLLDQALFVEAVAQAFGAVVGVVAEFGQQVIRTHELLEVGQYRVGFDQVFVRVGRRFGVRQARDAGHGAGVDRLLGFVAAIWHARASGFTVTSSVLATALPWSVCDGRSTARSLLETAVGVST